MKGLILKDLYLVWKNFKFYFAMCLIFLIFGILSENNFFMLFYPTLVCSMMPLNIIGFDEKSGWDRYSLCFPLSRRQLVGSKYLTSLILAVGILLLYSLAFASKALYMGTAGELLSNLRLYLTPLISVMFIGPAFVYPCIFKLGTHKGSMAYYLVLIAAFATGYAAVEFVDLSDIINFNLSLILIALPLIAVLLFALSFPLSAKILEKKDF